MSNDVSTHASTTKQRIQNALMGIVGSVPTTKFPTVDEMK
jgi:hypothetical protein